MNTYFDLRTRILLSLNDAIIEEKVDTNFIIHEKDPRVLYMFYTYEKYVQYYKEYLKNINYKEIDTLIFTRSKSGIILAKRDDLESYIINELIKNFYNSYSIKELDDIHDKGLLTAIDKFEEYRSHGLCPTSYANSEANRCRYFNTCSDCLKEYFSFKREYESIESIFKIVNNDDEIKLVKKNK